MTAAGMTKGERDQLVKLANLRARIAKAHVSEREAELVADVERQLAATYEATDEAWAEITAKANDAVEAADDEVARLCRERGVREEFRPRLLIGWWQRGENAASSRRSELRKVARTTIQAVGKRAKLAIDTRTAEVLTELIAGSLESAEAKAFLESIPTPEQLMPSFNIEAHLDRLAQHADGELGEADPPEVVRFAPQP